MFIFLWIYSKYIIKKNNLYEFIYFGMSKITVQAVPLFILEEIMYFVPFMQISATSTASYINF